ncbi:MAG: tetraacyldisaccharide 4'-kinase [Gammaproteobacteria bacterium]|nr:MAG: tetraacyldisaccharide 4'-kinase [Gammaproteobacteria bacterium]
MHRLDHYWYHKNAVTTLMRPMSWCFRGIVGLRRKMYRLGILERVRLPVPVVVVGNISVGGTGKTPLVIALVELLIKQGYKPGIITRGYGGEQKGDPILVTPDSNPYSVSDEAVLLAQRIQCPVIACPNRIASSQLLIEKGCDIIVSDDGLQHYRLERDIEIAVIDSSRGLGNGYCLPAGPLREPEKRLKTVDFVVVNGGNSDNTDRYAMKLQSHSPRRLSTDEEQGIDNFNKTPVHAIAAIGNPQRFYRYLIASGLTVLEHDFSDHHRYTVEDITFDDDYPVLMTEKDAVKCRTIAKGDNYWYITIDAVLDERFEPLFSTLLAQYSKSN